MDNGVLNTMRLTIEANNLVSNTTQWFTIDGYPGVSAFSVDSPYVYALATEDKLTLYRFVLDNQLDIQNITVISSLNIDSIKAMEFAPRGRYLYLSRGSILYALDIIRNTLDTVLDFGFNIENLQLTPLVDLAVRTSENKLSIVNDLDNPHFLAIEDISFYDVDNDLNYPSGWFPVVYFRHEPDTIQMSVPVTFYVEPRFNDAGFSTIIWNSYGDTIYDVYFDFEVNSSSLRVGFKSRFTGLIDVFHGEDSTYIRAYLPYNVYIEWPMWPEEFFWLEPQSVTLAIPEYPYDSVRWYYNLQYMPVYDDETSIETDYPGGYEVEAFFNGGAIKQNRTSIRYVPESIFDSLDIKYEVKFTDSDEFYDAKQGEVDIQAFNRRDVQINCFVDDTNNVLRDGRELDFYYLVGDSVVSGNQVNVRLNDNGDFLVLGAVNYLDKYLFTALIFRTDTMFIDYGDTLIIKYLKPLKLVFNTTKTGYNQDSSQYWVIANIGTPSVVSPISYNQSESNFLLKDFSCIYYLSQPLPVSEPLELELNGDQQVYLYEPQAAGDDSAYIIFDCPVVFSCDAQMSLNDFMQENEPQEETILVHESAITGRFYHIPFGIYRPDQFPDQDMSVLSLSPMDISSFGYRDKLVIFKASPELGQLENIDLIDENTSVSVKKLNDTVFELKTFGIVMSRHGRLRVSIGSQDQPLVDYIPYYIEGMEQKANFGGNFVRPCA